MKKYIFIGLAVLIVFMGCDVANRDYYRTESDFPEEGKGMLLLVLDGSEVPNKTITPDKSMVIESYRIIGKLGGVQKFTADVDNNGTDLPGGVHRENGLEPGTQWTIEVIAYNQSKADITDYLDPDIRIGSGGPTLEFTIGQSEIVGPKIIEVLPDTGTGYFTLTIPGLSAVTNPVFALARLYPPTSGYEDISLTISGDTATYSSPEKDTGYYKLELQLLGDDTGGTQEQVWGDAVSIRIVDQTTTNGVWESIVINASGGVEVGFDPDLKNPIDITITENGLGNGSITATAGLDLNDLPNPAPDSYDFAWYIDGVAKITTPVSAPANAGDPIENLQTFSSISTGNHNLSVIVSAKFGTTIDTISSVTYPFVMP